MIVSLGIAGIGVVAGVFLNIYATLLIERVPAFGRLRKTHFVIFSVVLFALALSPTLLLLVLGTPDPASPRPQATLRTHPTVLLSKDAFNLGPPSAYPREETDKIDLDTGERGYGKIVEETGVDLQPDNGRRTDVIIEETEIHAFSESSRSLAVLDRAEQAGYNACAIALVDDARRVGRIALRDFVTGSRLCVKSDEERIALISVLGVSEGPVLTISYVTWETH